MAIGGRVGQVAYQARKDIIPRPTAELADLRFRALLAEADWQRLPPAVRRRFSKRLSDGATAVYRGLVVEMGMSRAYAGAPAAATREEGERMLSLLADMVVLEVTDALRSASLST